MANNGALTMLNPGWKNIQAVTFGPYYRLILDGPKIDVTLTFRKDDLHAQCGHGRPQRGEAERAGERKRAILALGRKPKGGPIVARDDSRGQHVDQLRV